MTELEPLDRDASVTSLFGKDCPTYLLAVTEEDLVLRAKGTPLSSVREQALVRLHSIVQVAVREQDALAPVAGNVSLWSPSRSRWALGGPPYS